MLTGVTAQDRSANPDPVLPSSDPMFLCINVEQHVPAMEAC